MRFLLDQDVYAVTARQLQELGRDVLTAKSLGLSRADDTGLLATAAQGQRIFVSRDRDFGGLVFLERKRAGVIYLRIEPSTMNAVHLELERVLNRYTEEQLRNAFVVVEPGRHRFRQLPPQTDEPVAQSINELRSLIGALRKLTEKNLSNLTPHPVYSAFYYSHPTLLEREMALMKTAT